MNSLENSMGYFFTPDEFSSLLNELIKSGFLVIGPTIRDQAIVYDEVNSLADLPKGWTEEQSPGHYELKKRKDSAYFGYVVGPHSWKSYLHPPRESLWKAKKTQAGIQVEAVETKPQKVAFLGVRSCDLRAIQILDRVFTNNTHYQIRREDKFIIAVNCIESGNNCFCVSMDSGPQAKEGYDLSVTEIVDQGFLVTTGSAWGEDWIKKLSPQKASKTQTEKATSDISQCGQTMKKQLKTEGIKELLYENLNHPMWDEIAKTCLSCANCTMVCPTCFCSTVEDHTNLVGTETEQIRKWDSCFNAGHSYLHGGSVHGTTDSRYRQWMTHKFASWHDQFDSFRMHRLREMYHLVPSWN